MHLMLYFRYLRKSRSIIISIAVSGTHLKANIPEPSASIIYWPSETIVTVSTDVKEYNTEREKKRSNGNGKNDSNRTNC